MRRALLVKALESRSSIPGLPNKVETRDVAISGALTARLYTPPHGSETLPVLVYLHGGGWVAGSVATHDPFCRLLSEAAGVIIASIEYRLAPEHRHPAALEDALTAVHWAANNAAQWGGDAARLALGGDSAGGYLAAVAANRLHAAAGAPRLRALLLLYPATDHPSANHLSYTENATGYGLEAKLMRWMWEQYAPGASPDDPDVSPLRLHNAPCATAGPGGNGRVRCAARRRYRLRGEARSSGCCVSLTCTRRICITISRYTRLQWRGFLSLMPHSPGSPAGCGRRLLTAT